MGWTFTMNYTYSKELQLGAENDTGGGIINDILNPQHQQAACPAIAARIGW